MKKAESKRLTIREFLQTPGISNHLKTCLKNVWRVNITLDYMDQLDVNFLKTQRNFGEKKLTELAKIYPELRGLKYNNGWIKIESKKDLPKEELEYKVGMLFANGDFYLSAGVLDKTEVKLSYLESKITHYHPIEKQKPPIY